MSDDKIEPVPAIDRIRWDEEDAVHRRSRPALGRHDSTDSQRRLSIGSRRQVDPAITLPIEYRTVSFQIEESKGKEQAEKAKAKDSAAKDVGDLEWHTLGADEVAQRLRTSPSQGLSEGQVKQKQSEYGRNVFSPPKNNWFGRIFGYFFKGFGSVLLVGAILVFVSWKPLGDPPAVANLALAIVLLAVFFIQAAFTMYQDWSTSRVMSSIKDMLPEECNVIREGVIVHVPAANLVPGDVVSIKAGDKLPADMRLIQASSDAKFDRSVLTGESRPVAASVDHTDTNYLETRNIGLQGTHCILGSCTGIVVATGDTTIFGRIAKLTQEPSTKMTTLEREILHFVIIICSIMLTMIIIVIIVWSTWLNKDHKGFITVPTLIVDCVSVAIAFIPEGLPIAVTAGLTITANLMKENKILCKSLKTVETLGSVSVICSDKTGTLTTGKMTVSGCCVAAEELSMEQAEQTMREFKSYKANDANSSSAIAQLRALSALCNAGELDVADSHTPIAQRKVFGDATDTAILRFAECLEEGSVAYLRACWNKVFELAFNSKNKFMIRTFANVRPQAIADTLPQSNVSSFKANDLLLTIKGAPDVLLSRCTEYINREGIVATLTEGQRAAFENVKNTYSSQGKRCLLLAQKVVAHQSAPANVNSSHYEEFMTETAKSGLVLVGMVAILDPLRPEIPEVVATLRGAGIRINMVTGDFALTAVSIARNAGIITSPVLDTASDLPRGPRDSVVSSIAAEKESARGTSLVISGPELMKLHDYQWKSLTEYQEIVFARTTPEQKLRIVREFQAENVVAMTGDGVNDAPSLKAADVGISLGTGSDIAMEAADMVLMDTFSSMVIAVQYGRVVFDNLKKVIVYLLPAGSFSEFWPVMTNVLFGLPQILSSFLMIIICCFTDCAAATVLSFEKPEADVLLRRPRNVKKDRLVNWQLLFIAYGVIGIIETLASFAMSYWYLERRGLYFSDLWFSFGQVPDAMDPERYTQLLNEASSVYFVNLVVMQWFNVMAIRTRRLSIFQHPPLFNKATQNWYLFPAIIFAMVMAIFWMYVKEFRTVLGTSPVPVEHWFLPMTFGLFLLLLDEARKFAIRRWPKGLVAKMAW